MDNWPKKYVYKYFSLSLVIFWVALKSAQQTQSSVHLRELMLPFQLSRNAIENMCLRKAPITCSL